MDLTYNFIKDDDVTPIRACGTRCIEHLVEAFQRATSKFRIYLTDPENFGKNKTKKKTLRKRPQFYLISWRGNFAERHRFARNCAKTMPFLTISTPKNLMELWHFS